MNLHIEVSLSEEQIKAACRAFGCADPGDALRELGNAARTFLEDTLSAEAQAILEDISRPAAKELDPVEHPPPAPARRAPARKTAKRTTRKASRR